MYNYKFRYTPPEDEQDASGNITPQNKRTLKHLIEFIKEYMIEGSKLSAGLENKNKEGDLTLVHIHIHFQSEKKRDTIAKQFVRKWLHENDDFRKKSKCYCLKAESDIDTEKFFRYPFKETKDGHIKGIHMYLNMSQEEYTRLNDIAFAQRQIQYEVNQTKQSKKEDVTWTEKFCSYLDKFELNTHKEIFIKLGEFYISNDKPLNKKQLKDYSYMYMVKKDLMTLEEFYYLNE